MLSLSLLFSVCPTQGSNQEQVHSRIGSEACATPWGARQLQTLPPQPSPGKEEMLHPT